MIRRIPRWLFQSKKRKNIKEFIDCARTSKIERVESGRKKIINEKEDLQKRVIIEFNHQNKYLEKDIIPHHAEEMIWLDRRRTF